MESRSQPAFERIESKNLERSTKRTTAGFIYRTRNKAQVSFECLIKMFCAHQLCDVVLECEDRKIRAHKVILAASSTYFYYKFTKDAHLGLPKRLVMEFLDFETLSSVIEFFYKSEVRIGEDNVQRLLAAAYNLAARDLQEACWDFLGGNLSAGNCLDTLQMARRYQALSLGTATFDYLEENLSEVAMAGQHLQMEYGEFLVLMGRNVSCSAQDKLDLAVSWVRSDLERRQKYFCALIDRVDLSLVSHEHVLKKMNDESWLLSSPEFVLKYMQCLKIERPLIQPTKREESSKLLMVVGRTNQGKLSVEGYNFVEKVWLKGPETVEILSSGARTAIHGKTIYCFDGVKLKSAVINLDAAQMTLVDCKANLKPRSFCGLCVVGNTLHVAGGDHDRFLSTAESFDVSAGQSRRIASMSEGRDDLGLGTLNGMVYAVGGQTSRSLHSTSMECYDPRSDSWQAMPPMSIGRRWPGVGALGNELFVVGGWTNGSFKEVEAFNPTSRTWRRLPDLIMARPAPCVIAVEDKLFVIGGFNHQNSYLNSIEIFDPESNSWSLMQTPMNTCKIFVSAVLIDKSILNP